MKSEFHIRAFVNIILLFVLMLLPRAIEAPAPTAEQNFKPQGDVFSGVPSYFLHETALIDGYKITLNSVVLNGNTLQLDVDLVNGSERDILLPQALRLYSMENFAYTPNNIGAEDVLPAGTSQNFSLEYTLNESQIALENYRLVYMPFGYSGVVFVYYLVERPAQVTAPQEPESITPQAVYGTTGDPWKMLVLIYPNIDTDYVDSSGVSRHLSTSMPASDLQNMKAAFLNLPHQGVVYSYSDHAAELEANIVVVNRPLTSLTQIYNGYYPSPDVTRPELDQYVTGGNYDSVIVFWQASDPVSGQSIPDGGGWGWGGYWGNMTYATVYNLSWVWTTADQACHGEVFLHEWLHGVTGFYASKGVPFNLYDLHGAEEVTSKDYVALNKGCWDVWLRDYMRGLVYENGARKALVPEISWYTGSLTTYNITGWRGEYFNNQDLSGVPVLVRDDPEINFEWLAESPHPFVSNDGFSARWTKSINFKASDYRFDLFRDDGIRLKIDGVTVLDNWTYGREWVSVTQTMTAGMHTIQVEAYEIDGYSSAVFQYTNLAPCLDCGPANSAWPLFRQNSLHTAQTANAGPASPTVLWSYQDGYFDGSSPVIGPDNTVYVGLNNKLYAFGASGAMKWSYTAGGAVKSPALAANGTIYAASGDGQLHAINPDGTEKWSYVTGDWINASPMISPSGVVYIGSADGKFYAIDPDGTLNWSYTIGSWQNPSPALGADGTIYQGSTTWDVYALSPTGNLKWQYHTGGYVDASPVLGADGTLYIGSCDHLLYAINSDGTLKWTYSTDGVVGSPALGADGTIYFGSEDSHLYAVNPDGSTKWSYLTGGKVGDPSIDANGVIYAGSNDGYTYAVNSSGSLKWRMYLGGWTNSNPVIGSNQTVYTVHGGTIFALGARKEQAQNGGFETYQPNAPQKPANWVAAKFGRLDGKNGTRKSGNYSVRMVGAGTVTKSLSQTLGGGRAGDSFSFSYWVKGSMLPKAGTCQGQVLLYTTSGVITQTVRCPVAASYTWKQVKLNFSVPAAYSKAVIKFTFKKASGTIWLDGVSLVK